MCAISAYGAEYLIPVGQVIGLELTDNMVTVAAFDDALGRNAQAAGLRVGDKILKIDGKTVCCAEDVRQALCQSDGSIQLLLQRKGKQQTLTITPEITKDGPKLGIFLKEGVTGIGTVTYYDPDTGNFGALGHGVNNPDGEILQLVKGSAYAARVAAIKKGVAGCPGQLRGALNGTEPIGALTRNTNQGLFGKAQQPWKGKALPIAPASQIQKGSAKILATIDGNTVQEYSVEILKIYPQTRSGEKNMLLKITDGKLLASTGGIVQGMSGSPIIQDGKIIGAVTHVLVNDPTRGYGIFIENMLDAAS
jgi:stage IV sporulation protein B